MNLVKYLRTKLDEFAESSAYNKMVIIAQLRTAFSQCTIQDGKDAIDSITIDGEYRILLGVGMRGELYYYLAKRRGELLGV